MLSEDPHENDDARRARNNLVAILIVAVLLIAGWWLMSQMQRHRELENCLALGHRDCAPIVPEAGK